MNFRAKRQLLILGIAAILIIIAAGGLVYKLIPEPTCFDNRQNQDEEGVDCGGPCTSCALKEARPIETFWVRFAKTRAETYDLAAEIKNPNAQLAARAFDYEFRLIDSAGVIVAARQGRSFLYPGELTHLVEIGLKSGRDIRQATLTIANVEWQATAFAPPDVIAGFKEHRIETSDGLTFSSVRALIANRTNFNFEALEVRVLLFDRDGNFLGASFTRTDELGPGETREVLWRWPMVFSQSPSSITVESRVPLEVSKGL